MSTRDIGTHIVELHEHGMLAISGEGTRVTLTAQETLSLLNWLNQQRKTILQAAHAESAGELPDWLHSTTETVNVPPEDRELPVDEP